MCSSETNPQPTRPTFTFGIATLHPRYAYSNTFPLAPAKAGVSGQQHSGSVIFSPLSRSLPPASARWVCSDGGGSAKLKQPQKRTFGARQAELFSTRTATVGTRYCEV